MTEVSKTELFGLVNDRRNEVRAFLEFALNSEREARLTGEAWRSLRLANRPDIKRARTAAEWFPETWWGVVVYTCFDSLVGTEDVREPFQQPLPDVEAWEAVEKILFRRGAVRGHRIRPGVGGAKKALVAASEHDDFFRRVLHAEDLSFEERYEQIRAARLPQWGRTTTFDLLFRSGALALGGVSYTPTTAQLAGSTGPQRGFTKIWGVTFSQNTFEWGEALLRAWTAHWNGVAEKVAIVWDEGPAYSAGDFENALCIWQE